MERIKEEEEKIFHDLDIARKQYINALRNIHKEKFCDGVEMIEYFSECPEVISSYEYQNYKRLICEKYLDIKKYSTVSDTNADYVSVELKDLKRERKLEEKIKKK